jgi:hypothetical protein
MGNGITWQTWHVARIAAGWQPPPWITDHEICIRRGGEVAVRMRATYREASKIEFDTFHTAQGFLAELDRIAAQLAPKAEGGAA